MKPRILSRVARVENVGLALPTGSDEEKFDWKTFSAILTCTWETGTPEQDRAVWKSAPPEKIKTNKSRTEMVPVGQLGPLLYLKLGTGNPCTGQSNDRPMFE
ncbi:hypothetical protein RUM43_011255 [Polyplax serrata]|uniref:Uncharacterized protein n=1 Tax=Polyplax serrata TaxID=468196 RepID=A0AAN8S7S9_POLSC